MARKPTPTWPTPYEDADVYAVQALFADEKHRRALDYLALASGVYERSAVPADPYMTYFNEGRRDTFRQYLYVSKLNMPAIVEARSKLTRRK